MTRNLPDEAANTEPGPTRPACDAPERSLRERPLSDAAIQALAEAEERRRVRQEVSARGPKEIGGREGPDPVRYGDWEKDGIASDF